MSYLDVFRIPLHKSLTGIFFTKDVFEIFYCDRSLYDALPSLEPPLS